MRQKIILLLVATALLALTGCETNKPRAYKMQQNSGKMNRGSDVGYRAICKAQVAGGHENPWAGPMYPEKERAMRDAVEHNKLFPGHDATIEH